MAEPPAADDPGGRSVSPAIHLPPDALVVLIGIAGSGKSTFATRYFAPTEILSSDALRALISDDPMRQEATDDAFDLLHRILAMRLRRGRLTVVDATNVEDWARAELIGVARRHRRPAVAIVLEVPLQLANDRNASRPARRPPPAALQRQYRWLRDSLPGLAEEGFAEVHVLRSPGEVARCRVDRGPRSAAAQTKRPKGTGVRL
jgi:protein phosphatase